MKSLICAASLAAAISAVPVAVHQANACGGFPCSGADFSYGHVGGWFTGPFQYGATSEHIGNGYIQFNFANGGSIQSPVNNAGGPTYTLSELMTFENANINPMTGKHN